ncbi:MAG: hypothetical protein ACI9C1_003003 [Candidatus Aldehydirespiratoraceae bacterium]|jgi:hypothetical protein
MGSTRLLRGLSADGFPGWTGDINDRACRLATRSIMHAICGETSVPSTLSTLQAWRDESVLDDVGSIHVGANGGYDEDELDQLIDAARVVGYAAVIATALAFS